MHTNNLDEIAAQLKMNPHSRVPVNVCKLFWAESEKAISKAICQTDKFASSATPHQMSAHHAALTLPTH